MARLTNIEKFFKKVNLSIDDELFVGVDVHKRTYHVALFLNDMPVLDFGMSASPEKLSEKLLPMKRSVKNIVYEAGPTGYGLARHLAKNGLPAMVTAASAIPSVNGANKTDRIDSKKLARYLAKGLLRPIAIPTEKEEANRQLSRMRQRRAKQRAKVKVQIKSFLLMHGIAEPSGLKNWTVSSVNSLRRIRLSKKLRLSLDDLLYDYDYLTSRLKNNNEMLVENLGKGVLGHGIDLLMTHPGIGIVVASQFATELCNYKDFNTTRQLYRYLGLSPRIHQSGEKSNGGPISKIANIRLRQNLIESAWTWVNRDIEARKCFYRILNNCGGIKQKAIVAMARKLSGHLLMMLQNNEPYDRAKSGSRIKK